MAQKPDSVEASLQKLVALTKSRGFIFPNSEIYGGFQATYDYGPYGVELKNNLKRLWWKAIVQERIDVVGQDGAIFTHPKVWEASGHVAAFADPLAQCTKCSQRFRVDHLLEEKTGGTVAGKTLDEMSGMMKELKIVCPNCGSAFNDAKQFNLLVKAQLGVTEDTKSDVYLRGETCQNIYLNFESILGATRKKLPFGIAQIGKAFRNEITVKNFIFRMREFEQAEMQYFVMPGETTKHFDPWKATSWSILVDRVGIAAENLRWRQHEDTERAHYAKDAWDIEYQFPFGWKELMGVHDRGNWDMSRHSEYSGEKLTYFDPETNTHVIPEIVETSIGVDRLVLAVLSDAYAEEETTTASGEKDVRVVMRFSREIAPVKIAVLPLSKKDELSGPAQELTAQLAKRYAVEYDETGSIGKRYRRQDEIGTPYCITVDFETLNDKAVTVRDRDTMQQERIPLDGLDAFFREKFPSA